MRYITIKPTILICDEFNKQLLFFPLNCFSSSIKVFSYKNPGLAWAVTILSPILVAVF